MAADGSSKMSVLRGLSSSNVMVMVDDGLMSMAISFGGSLPMCCTSECVDAKVTADVVAVLVPGVFCVTVHVSDGVVFVYVFVKVVLFAIAFVFKFALVVVML